MLVGWLRLWPTPSNVSRVSSINRLLFRLPRNSTSFCEAISSPLLIIPILFANLDRAAERTPEMVAQSYQRVSRTNRTCQSVALTTPQVPGSEEEVPETPQNAQQLVPNSPPPAFRSRASSISSRRNFSQRSGTVDPTLEDTFAAGPNEDESVEDDRQRLIRTATTSSERGQTSRPNIPRAPTTFPSIFGSGRGANTGPSTMSNDGVFANLNAKPERGEKLQQQPPGCSHPALDRPN